MFTQKLITLAGVLGILACGACFAPRYVPPPPPPIAHEGIKSLRVVVIDQTEAKRLNIPALTGLIALDLNNQHNRVQVIAYPTEKPPAEVDATLEVKILAVSVLPETTMPNAIQRRWTFRVSASSALVRSSGEVIWRSQNITESPQLDSYAREMEEMWKDPVIQNSLLRRLGNRLSFDAIYQTSKVLADDAPPLPLHMESGAPN